MRKLVRFSSILLLAAVLFSCKQNVNYDGLKSQEIQGQQAEKQVDKADDYVTVKLDVSKAAREAFVPGEDSGRFLSYKLTGYFNGSKNLTEIMQWDNYDSIKGSEFSIRRGNWDLTLTATAWDYNEITDEYKGYPVLTGSCSKNITSAETISFKLDRIPDSEAPGEYYIYLHYPKSEYWSISASVKDLETLTSFEDERYNPVIKADSGDFAEIHGKVPAGEYKLGIKFVYKSDSLETVSTVPVYIVVAPGCQTHGDIFLDSTKLNMACPINYVGYDADKGNYILPKGFPTHYSSFESLDLPTPIRTDSDNYDFVGWYTNKDFWSDTKIEKTPLYNESGENELTLYPRWCAKSSPYFSLEEDEGISFVLTDKTKALFTSGKATSLQYFVKNTETGYEINVWFSAEDLGKMNYEWNYPFVDNGTYYEAYVNIGDVEASGYLGIVPKTGIGEDEHIYDDDADIKLDDSGELHITNIPDYTNYKSLDASFTEQYFMQIWKDDWSECVKEVALTLSKERSVDIDITSYLEEAQLFGKPFIVNCRRDCWYKGKKYSIGCGQQTFTYGEEYKANYSKDDVYTLNCTGFETSIEFANPVAAGSGYTKVYVEFMAESKSATQVCFQLQDSKNGIMSSDAGTVYSENFDKYVKLSKPCLAGVQYSDYSTGSEVIKDCSDAATGIRFFFQDGNSDFTDVPGTVYVRKVWLTAKDKDDLIIFDSKNYNGGASSAAGSTYYSYEITSGGVTYLFDNAGKLTGKADGSEIDDIEMLMEDSFISITLDKDISELGDSGKYTSLIISGSETVLTDDDPDAAALLAESYKYTYENSTLTILSSTTTVATMLIGKDGSITYINGNLTYKFKKAE